MGDKKQEVNSWRRGGRVKEVEAGSASWIQRTHCKKKAGNGKREMIVIGGDKCDVRGQSKNWYVKRSNRDVKPSWEYR